MSLTSFYFLLDFLWKRELRGVIESAREKGRLQTLTEIYRNAPPSRENAATTYVKAFLLMSSGDGGHMFGADGEGRCDSQIHMFINQANVKNPFEISDDEANTFESIFQTKRLEDINLLLKEAVDKPYLNFSWKRSIGPPTNPSYVRFFIDTIKFLCGEALVKTRLDPSHDDWSHIILSIKMTRQFRQDYLLSTQLARLEAYDTISQTLDRLVNLTGVNDRDAIAMVNQLGDDSLLRDFHRSLLAEQTLAGEYVFTPLMTGSLNPDTIYSEIDSSAYTRQLPIMFVTKDYISYLRIMSDALDLFDMPYWECLKNHRIQYLNHQLNTLPFFCPLAKTFCSPLPEIRIKLAKCRASIHQTRIHLGLSVYQNNEKHYPETLTELEPVIFKTIPLDPFTGKNFEYSTKHGQYTLHKSTLE